MPEPVFPRSPLLTGSDSEQKRAEILRYFHATFDRYEQLFEVLTCDEAYYRKPIALRHPLIFYLGHTATFFINKLLLAGVIDRLYSPRKFLESAHTRLNPGGLLLIASPYTWLPEHTKREEWIGGFKKDGENFTTLDGLKVILSEHFRLMRGPLPVPFVIRETKRKFQHTISEVTLWERL